MRKKLTVAVLMGGKSPEHEISLISGREVAKNLSPKKYNVLPIIVSKDGVSWQIGERHRFLLNSPSKRKAKSIVSSDHSSIIKDHKVDVVFIAMHGPNGEDGTVQGFLDLIGVPYTGSGVLASALGMDKIYSLKLFTQSRLKVPKSIIVNGDENITKVWQQLHIPVFVKPASHGSSIGVSKVSAKSDLKDAVDLARKYSSQVIVQEFIDGMEVTCAILGNDKPKALPLVEIVPKKEFFDYEAKYDEKLTDEIVPARISKDLTKKAQEIALTAYKTLGCRGFGRVDMIIKDSEVYVLEINTIPGLTPVSLFPKAAQAAGISYPALLDKIIQFALES